MTIIAAPKSTAQPNQKSAVDESRNTDKEIISSQKDDGLILGVQEQEKKNEDESIIPSPTPTPTSTPTPQPTPISTPTPIPTPKPTIIPTVIPTIVPTSTPYIPPPTLAPAISTSPYSCDCSKTCSQMSSCDEAYYQLNTCGCTRRDGDNDGVPCESICN